MECVRSGRHHQQRDYQQYAFELPDVPTEETEYLEVLYPARLARFDTTMQGDTFSRVFGANTSCLENFIIQRDIMGACMLVVAGVCVHAVRESMCQVSVLTCLGSRLLVSGCFWVPGPCWLQIEAPQPMTGTSSWCKYVFRALAWRSPITKSSLTVDVVCR